MPNLWEQFSDEQLIKLRRKNIHMNKAIEIEAELQRRRINPEYRTFIHRQSPEA